MVYCKAQGREAGSRQVQSIELGQEFDGLGLGLIRTIICSNAIRMYGFLGSSEDLFREAITGLGLVLPDDDT